MMKFDREQIVKTLECHASGKLVECERCPLDKAHLFNATCVQVMCENALALIKELTEENFLLEQKRVNMFEILDAYGRGRTDGVRKFADYLKKQSFNCDPGNGFSFDAIDVDELGNYVKEFLEDSEYEKDT